MTCPSKAEVVAGSIATGAKSNFDHACRMQIQLYIMAVFYYLHRM
jgi:hypothetical protein